MGNGRATAIVFAREGARVLLVDRDEVSAQETQELIAKEGGSAEVFVADIAAEGACEGLAEEATRRLGRIDVLHNNVGIGAGDAGAISLEPDAWDRIFNVNLRAMWLTCKYVVPVMRKQGSGSIVNISSVAAIAVAPILTAYKVSKAGVNALTHSLATSNARYGIRVNAIMPGLIDTPMGVDDVARIRGIDRDELAKQRASLVPLGHQGTAWDIANAALFLASDEAAFITGVVLPVDGGQTALIG
jgi:NAD(P)-dependent dehydrogenase (short-subunit alcohol dehydrogenase family)